ncbi:hypothetical protein I6M49_22430 [Shewanella algae]|uniref:phage baseplate assembly protein n=1 Tax=Shewanella algae TaxID=38313 RepID=UPI001AAC92FB|nr:hypothetical protein [Shewanella algae]MBO2656204.1 hypothetical protein [Shewanella algae]
MLLTTNAGGDLVVTQAGNELISPALKMGQNILEGRYIDSMLQRASVYIIKGSASDLYGSDTTGMGVAIADENIHLYRPKIIICETAFTQDVALQRGQWQRCRDLGSSHQAEYTVAGWSHDNGLYRPNQLVHIDDELTELNEQWLIVRVSLEEGENGRLAALTVQPPEALVITKQTATMFF